MFLGVFLAFIVVCASVSASSPSQNDKRVFFDVTDDVKIKVTPPTVYAGFTRSVDLTCSFAQKPGSDFSTLHAVIISKTESDPKQYRELATITSKTGDDVQQGSSLGATASGHFSATNGSYITLKWTYPGMEVKGRYVCEGYGLDEKGHPRVSYANIDINVVEKGIGNEMVLQKIQEMESRIDAQSARIGQLENTKNELSQVLNQSTIPIQYQTSWHGHTYLLSNQVNLKPYFIDLLCQQYGGYALEIDTEAEWVFVNNLTKTVLKNGRNEIHLGGTDKGHPGTWTLPSSGNTMTVFHWGSGQPNSGDQHCLLLDTLDAPTNTLHDYNCRGYITDHFMCEFDYV